MHSPVDYKQRYIYYNNSFLTALTSANTFWKQKKNQVHPIVCVCVMRFTNWTQHRTPWLTTLVFQTFMPCWACWRTPNMPRYAHVSFTHTPSHIWTSATNAKPNIVERPHYLRLKHVDQLYIYKCLFCVLKMDREHVFRALPLMDDKYTIIIIRPDSNARNAAVADNDGEPFIRT